MALHSSRQPQRRSGAPLWRHRGQLQRQLVLVALVLLLLSGGSNTQMLLDDRLSPPDTGGRELFHPQGGVPQLLWADDFNGPSLGSHWVPELGDGSAKGIPGWGNSELQCYASDKVNLGIVRSAEDASDGLLRIRALRASPGQSTCFNGGSAPPSERQWTSARLTTRGTAEFAPRLLPAGPGSSGRQWCAPIALEARMRFPGRQGLWGAFWALGANGQWPAGGEIDVVEHVNTDASVFGTLHFAAADGGHRQLPVEPANRLAVSGGGGPAGGFHTYRVEVGCDAVTWLVDGVPAQRVTRAAVAAAASSGGNSGPGEWPFDKPFYLLLNLAVGGTLAGADVDPAGGDMLVDWVRVWQLPAYQLPA